jgi:hypothetical protein
MQRISTSTRALNLFGTGKDGFKNGDLAAGLQATRLNAEWFNSVQEELCRLVVGAGIDLDVEVNTQLLQAVRRMSGGNVRTVTTGHTVLTADDAGLVLVNAAAGTVTITLPSANVLNALPFKFQRIDATDNLVTVSAAEDDAIDGTDVSFVLADKNDGRQIVSNGAAGWHSGVSGLTWAQADARYVLVSSTETGKVSTFMRTSAPNGYIKANGKTIGSAASGATNRANADTLALFTLWWTEFDNTVLHIQTSEGEPTTRGASAAADWAANKRLPVFDRRGNSSRGWDDGRGFDEGRVLGSYQADALQNITGQLNLVSGGVSEIDGAFAVNPDISVNHITAGLSGTDQGILFDASLVARTAHETRSANIAELVCYKL